MKSIKFNRKAYEREFRLLHSSYETYALPIFQNALKKQLKAIADQVRANGNVALFQTAMDNRPMQVAYLKVYEYVGVQHAEFTYKWIDRVAGKKAIGFFSELWRKAMAIFYSNYGAQKVAEVDDTTIRDIQRILSKATLDNLTQSETATYLADELDNPKYTRMRAMRISRTESTTAANYGSQLAAESSDYECGKVWIPVVDKRTRLGHKKMANKEAIGLYDSFVVDITKGDNIIGQDLMQYPGDPTADVANLVNCRCTHAVSPLADENGLPILK